MTGDMGWLLKTYPNTTRSPDRIISLRPKALSNQAGIARHFMPDISYDANISARSTI